MAQRIQHRRGTAAQWAAANPTLAMGEWGLDITVGRVKIGDGTTAWSLLPFAVDGGSVAQTDPLRQFSTALAKASTAPVTVVVVGDSLSEDWQWVDGAVVTPDPAGLRSWVRLFEVDLAERFHGGAVGVGWLAIRAGLGTNPGWDTVTGAAIETAGLGFYAVELEATEYAEHAEVCDGVDIYIDSIVSTLTIHVDGVLTETLTASASPQVWSSGALSAASHTIKVTAVGGTAKVYGSYWYLGNRTSGVQVHNGGHSGAGPLDHSTIRGTLEHIALVQPDLVIVPIGAAAGAGGGFDAGVSAYSTNVLALLDDIAAEAPSASIVHVAEHALDTRAATWPPFAVASKALAAEGGWGFADCYATIGCTDGDPYDLAIFDETHLNGRGHRVMADTILNAVVGPTTRLDGAVLTAPSGDTSDVHFASGTGPRARLASILGTVGLYLRRAADTEERGVFSDSGIAWGSGTAALDSVIQRVSPGLLAVTGALRFTEQTAPSSPAANTIAVYAEDDGAGVTVMRTKDSSGTVRTLGAATSSVAGLVELGTDAETQTGTDTTRAPSLASAAATFLRKVIPTATLGTITHADGGQWSFFPIIGVPFLGLRRTGDANDRALLSESAVSFGDGTSAYDFQIARTAAGVGSVTGAFLFTEQTDASAPAANKAVLYCRDNGAGKTQIVARFPTGVVQVLATEP